MKNIVKNASAASETFFLLRNLVKKRLRGFGNVFFTKKPSKKTPPRLRKRFFNNKMVTKPRWRLLLSFLSKTEAAMAVITKFLNKPKPRCRLLLSFLSKPKPRWRLLLSFLSKPKPRCQLLLSFLSKPKPGWRLLLSFLSKPKPRCRLLLSFLSKPKPRWRLLLNFLSKTETAELFY